MESKIRKVRLENRWEAAKWLNRTKTCDLNVNGRIFPFRSESQGLQIHPFQTQLSFNQKVLHSITEDNGVLIDENGHNAVNTPSRWPLCGQELTFSDGLTVQIPSLPLFRAKFDCDECYGQLLLSSNDYIDGYYKGDPPNEFEQMLPRFFQLLWVTALFGWGGG